MPHSVVYIACGSLYFPPTPDQLLLLVDVIKESGLRVVIVTYNYPEALTSSPKWSEWVDAMGSSVLLAPWLDQRAVLAHEAVSFTITHGGINSAHEALLGGTPMVMWPDAWDANFIARKYEELGIAIELLQVRTRHVGRTARGVKIVGTEEAMVAEMKDVIEVFKSDRGDKIRMRVQEVRKLVLEDMEAGDSFRGMLELGHLAEE